MKTIKPSVLKQKHLVGLVSNSAPLAGLVPHRTKNGINMLEKMGFKVIVGKSALKINDYMAGSPKERVEDINLLFKNKKIKAIISFIGGDHSNQLLKLINYKIIKKNPKIVMGFSDTTVLLLAIYSQTGMIVFYGPSILNQFAENPEICNYTKNYFIKAVMSKQPIGKIIPSKLYTEEILDWFEKKDLSRPRKFKKNPGWLWLKNGSTRGILIGGCITSIMHLRGTTFWPNFKNSILFWEISESDSSIFEGKPISAIDSCLTDLDNSGVFEKINGMIIGRPYRYSKKMENDLKILIKQRTKKYKFPILYGVDFGHTDPMITIPIGVKAILNSKKNIFEIVESGVI